MSYAKQVEELRREADKIVSFLPLPANIITSIVKLGNLAAFLATLNETARQEISGLRKECEKLQEKVRELERAPKYDSR